MKTLVWDKEKNEKLIKERGVGFDDMIEAIRTGGLLAVRENPNQKKYSGQVIMIINFKNYVYYVPFKETKTELILVTIIPSRKLTKEFLK